nr:zinc finger CCCH domain-containing protein 44-like [Tanacetum cinerariifolium]
FIDNNRSDNMREGLGDPPPTGYDSGSTENGLLLFTLDRLYIVVERHAKATGEWQCLAANEENIDSDSDDETLKYGRKYSCFSNIELFKHDLAFQTRTNIDDAKVEERVDSLISTTLYLNYNICPQLILGRVQTPAMEYKMWACKTLYYSKVNYKKRLWPYEEREHRLHAMPVVRSDPKMNPDYESYDIEEYFNMEHVMSPTGDHMESKNDSRCKLLSMIPEVDKNLSRSKRKTACARTWSLSDFNTER